MYMLWKFSLGSLGFFSIEGVKIWPPRLTDIWLYEYCLWGVLCLFFPFLFLLVVFTHIVHAYVCVLLCHLLAFTF